MRYRSNTHAEDKDANIARELSYFEPGRLSLPVFIAVAHLTVTPVIEVVPIHESDHGQISVLLTKRPDDDPIWPAMWHTPGTVIRAYDNSINDGLARLLATELGNGNLAKPEYVGYMLHRVLRGTELALIHWMLVEKNVPVGTLFDVKDLPEEIVDSQRPFISWAIDCFHKSSSKSS